MNSDGVYESYLIDLVSIVVERAIEARDSADSEFELGQAFALAEVLAWIRSQAVTFSIPLDELGLDSALVSRLLLGLPGDEA